VDDGSPDQCPEMFDAWGQKDARIKVIHKKNGGLGDARNAGLDVATGNLIGFIDSDDWCESTMFERMVATYREYRTSIVVCDVWVDWENGWPSETKCMGGNSPVWDRLETAEAFYCDDLPAWMCNKIFERSLWNGVRFSAQLYEDIPVMRKFVGLINGAAFTHSAEYHYIQHQSSIVNSDVRDAHLIYLYETIENFEAAKCLSEKAAAKAQQELVRVAYSLLYKLVVQGTMADKQSELAGIIRENWRGKNNFKLPGKLDRLIAEKIAMGRHYVYLMKVHDLLKVLYFKLKIKELIGKMR
jgi:glycosyltransferase involved in cell wall biosynthesis